MLTIVTSPEQLLPRRSTVHSVPVRVQSGKAVTTEPDQTGCTNWQLSPRGEGRLLATPSWANSTCGWPRDPDLDLTRITPMAESMEPWTSTYATSNSTPVLRILQLHGIWLMPGTGEVLSIGGRGTSPADYAIYAPGADSPHEAGTVWVQRGGGVVFVSDTVDTRCTTAYDGFSTDTATLTGRVAPNTCTRIGGPDTVWVRL
jgi:hypothetical protein